MPQKRQSESARGRKRDRERTEREREEKKEIHKEITNERTNERKKERERASSIPNDLAIAGNRATQVEFLASVLPVL